MPLARRLRVPVSLVLSLLSLAACAGDESIGTGNHDPALTLRVTPKLDSLGIGGTLQLSARVTDGAGLQQSATVAWMSVNNAIATVSASGLVTAVSTGRVGIVATIGTSADTASIIVKQGELIVEPNAVIFDYDANAARLGGEDHTSDSGVRMTSNVGECLLHNPV